MQGADVVERLPDLPVKLDPDGPLGGHQVQGGRPRCGSCRGKCQIRERERRLRQPRQVAEPGPDQVMRAQSGVHREPRAVHDLPQQAERGLDGLGLALVGGQRVHAGFRRRLVDVGLQDTQQFRGAQPLAMHRIQRCDALPLAGKVFAHGADFGTERLDSRLPDQPLPLLLQQRQQRQDLAGVGQTSLFPLGQGQMVGHLAQVDRTQQEQRYQEQPRNQDRLGPETQQAKQPDTGRPHPMVCKEAFPTVRSCCCHVACR